MIRRITPLVSPVRANVTVPGSKSITNRALICASLAQGASHIRNASGSDDTNLLANGLNQLGVLARRQGNELVVEGNGGTLYAPRFPIPVGNAGTTLRFLTGLAALAQGRVHFSASSRMAERPMDELLDALNALGTRTRHEPTAGEYAVEGGTLEGGTVRLQADKSSQFLSSLLMVGAYAKRGLRMESGELVSEPYVEMTMRVMEDFGVKVDRPDRNTFIIETGQRYTPVEYVVEPDASSASYFFAVAALLGGSVTVQGLGAVSMQGDREFAGILQRMGCEVRRGGNDLEVSRHGPLRAIDVDMNTMPDLVPTLAVVALFAEGPSSIRNVGHLRYKESDRLESLATELRKVGANIHRTDAGLTVEPAKLNGGQLDTYDDHRLAMSFALIGLRVPGVSIENPECVRKSFPGFWSEFEKLHS